MYPYFSSPNVLVRTTSSCPGVSVISKGPFAKNSLTLAGVPSCSFISVSKAISDSSFATKSASPSPAVARRAFDVEKAAVYCSGAGFHVDCNKEKGRDTGRRIEEVVRRETARGAERANDLMDSMMKGWITVTKGWIESDLVMVLLVCLVYVGS